MTLGKPVALFRQLFTQDRRKIIMLISRYRQSLSARSSLRPTPQPRPLAPRCSDQAATCARFKAQVEQATSHQMINAILRNANAAFGARSPYYGSVLLSVAFVFVHSGDLLMARSTAGKAVELLDRRVGFEGEAAKACALLGFAQVSTDLGDKAITHFERAIALYRAMAVPMPEESASALSSAADWYLCRGQFVTGLERSLEAWAILIDLRDIPPQMRAMHLSIHTKLLARNARYAEALPLLEEGYALFKKMNLPHMTLNLADFCDVFGDVCLALHRRDEALKYYREALVHFFACGLQRDDIAAKMTPLA